MNNRLLVILLIIISFVIGYFTGRNPKQEEIIIEQVDSIYVIKESIQEKIDTVYIKIQDNNKQYEEDVNHIINNDVNEDISFFLEYINSYRLNNSF